MSEFTTPLKRCHNCNRDLPATLEYWHRAKNKRGEPSLATQCKDCAKARAKKWASENPERNRAKSRQWIEEHPEQARQTKREYYAANKDKFRAYKHEHQSRYLELKQSPEYKAKEAARRKHKAKELREYNREYRAAHPGWQADAMKDWRKRHPERDKANIHRRIARKHAADGNYTADDVRSLYELQEGRCVYCGMRIFMDIAKDVHVDHVLPLSRGGSNSPDNLALTCSSCNHSKGARTIREWQAIRGW